jgi:hypothetical protein
LPAWAGRGSSKLKVGPQARSLSLGEKVWLVPGHCDPTVNLHDWYVGVRNGRVEALWPINARGASSATKGISLHSSDRNALTRDEILH